MARRARKYISSEFLLIRQKGDFFINEDEKKIYIDTLNFIVKNYNVEIYGYILQPSEIYIFLKSSQISKNMQTLNSTFIRRRNKLRETKEKSKIERFQVRETDISEFDDVLSFIAKNGGYIFRQMYKKIDLAKKIQIQNFNKRKNMKLVALNAKEHGGLSYHTDTFIKAPIAEIVASEALACEKDFVIVFSNDIVPRMVVLFGKDTNILIDKNFKGYIPATVKNYPFVLSELNGDYILCVDIEAPQLKGKKGEKLFVNEEPSDFLKKAIEVMKVFNKEVLKTQAIMQDFKKAGILINKELSADIEGKKTTLVKGFSIVSRKKLNELDDATLADFARKGYIELINSHLRSLSNFENLAVRIVKNAGK
ncbi:SapC family protein [Campylobacter sp. RM16187]|uniref:SapC family protein n=1 Tax=Campylobacter sp. RM16187 TaxID=1660063 RepID=UPI0021B59FE8|nr:SapC family protein [Campylobacter sp. RM16187]